MNWWKKQRSAPSLTPLRGSSSTENWGEVEDRASRAQPLNSDRAPISAAKINHNDNEALGLQEQNEFRLWPEAQRALGAQPGRKAYVVPSGYKITGELFCRYRMVIIEGEFVSGRLEGQVVRVAPGGIGRGEIDVGLLQAAGLVDADVRARVGVQVSSSGELTRRVRAPNVRVESGAKLYKLEVEVG
jgi:hypothetical protein